MLKSLAPTAQRLMSLHNLILLALGVAVSTSLAVSGGVGTLAAFTASVSNDNSSLSTVNFNLTESASGGVSSGVALFSISDAEPGDWVQKNISLTSVGKSDLTLQLADGTSGGVAAPLNATTDQALQIRVESCADNTFSPATCTGVANLNGGVTAGTSTPSASNTVKYASVKGVPQTLQTGLTSGTAYYKVFMRIPAGTVGGGSGSDNDFINKSASVKWTWTLTSSSGSLRSPL